MAQTQGGELTLRGVLLGVAITLVFTAANVYFGLKAGLTFATSIPAAVISMALLRGFSGVTVQENNIVQTVASSAGTLSAIIFVLPGLVMIGWWQHIPYWQTLWVCALGGVLGVTYTIPLRRALVTDADLPYPEGVACAEVLKVGSGEGADRAGLLSVTIGALASAGFALVVSTRLFASNLAVYFRLGRRGATGFDFSLSFALFAVGHLVGLTVGLAMLAGAAIGWGVAVPYYTALHAGGGVAAAMAQQAWSHQVRFIGAGAIGAAAVWALLGLVRPVATGLGAAMAAGRSRRAGGGAAMPRTEQDLPLGRVVWLSLLSLLAIAVLLHRFADAGGLGAAVVALVGGGVLFVALVSFLVAAVCGYMAGLIGSSNSPLSGIGILVVVFAALLLVLTVQHALPERAGQGLVAFALFTTAIIFAAATIANDNLQDLKTGQLVDATPWKQQVALLIGVAAGAVVIPPVLELLNRAYGFVGAPGVDAAHALPAPQAGLISALAEGVITGRIDWSLIAIGALIGVAAIVLDTLLARLTSRLRLPPLAVGLGIYLPTSTTLMVVVGALAGWLYDRRAASTPRPGTTRRLGVLLASGMIVGESLMGIALAALVVFSGREAPLALVDSGSSGLTAAIGALAFAAGIVLLYRAIRRF